jgi:hypothetical protein
MEMFAYKHALAFISSLPAPPGAGTACFHVTMQQTLRALQDAYDAPRNAAYQLHCCCTCSSGRCDALNQDYMSVGKPPRIFGGYIYLYSGL